MSTESYRYPEYLKRPTAVLLAAGSLALGASCQSSPPSPETSPPTVTATTSYPDAEATPIPSLNPALAPTPSPTATPEITDCTSIRAVRPNAYYNVDHQTGMTKQLDLMRLALALRGNVDIDDDGKTFIALSHQMEEDPRYAAAMSEAYRRLSTQQDQPLSAAMMLRFSIPPAQLRAPQTLTRQASIDQLNETKTVSHAVGSGLLRHLSAQATNATRLLSRAFSREVQALDNRLAQALVELRTE